MNTRYLFIALTILSGCSFKKSPQEIIIKGTVKNIPATKLYLTDAYNWKVFLDSAEYKNDTFSFHINPDKFEPFAVSIAFIDSQGKIKQLFYNNYILSNESKKYSGNAFFVDKGVTIISSIRGTLDRLEVSPNKQTDPFYKTQLSGFGWIPPSDKAKREKVIEKYKDLIKRYRDSYYFIFMLESYRTLYSKEELISLINLFDKEIQSSKYGMKIFTYLKEKPSSNHPLPNYSFKNSSNSYQELIDSSSSLNMIILWASWCGPCRREIPKLKELNTQFEDKGLHMVSVSIDEDHGMWRNALLKEKMAWDQLIVDSARIEEVHNSFDFSSIPVIIFTNKEGFEIKRFNGYEAGNEDEYKTLLKKYLKQ